jgi:hypothetical protein
MHFCLWFGLVLNTDRCSPCHLLPCTPQRHQGHAPADAHQRGPVRGAGHRQGERVPCPVLLAWDDTLGVVKCAPLWRCALLAVGDLPPSAATHGTRPRRRAGPSARRGRDARDGWQDARPPAGYAPGPHRAAGPGGRAVLKLAAAPMPAAARETACGRVCHGRGRLKVAAWRVQGRFSGPLHSRHPGPLPGVDRLLPTSARTGQGAHLAGRGERCRRGARRRAARLGGSPGICRRQDRVSRVRSAAAGVRQASAIAVLPCMSQA